MKNLTNLIIKSIIVLGVLFVFIPIFGRGTWTQTIIIGLVLVALSYVAGDMWILPKYGNWVAVLADLSMAVLVIWLMARALPQFTLSVGAVWIIALILSVGEWLFHRYLLKTHATDNNKNPQP